MRAQKDSCGTKTRENEIVFHNGPGTYKKKKIILSIQVLRKISWIYLVSIISLGLSVSSIKAHYKFNILTLKSKLKKDSSELLKHWQNIHEKCKQIDFRYFLWCQKKEPSLKCITVSWYSKLLQIDPQLQSNLLQNGLSQCENIRDKISSMKFMLNKISLHFRCYCILSTIDKIFARLDLKFPFKTGATYK